jgi:hypothetical protein
MSRITIRLPHLLYQRLIAAASRKRVSIAGFARECIELVLDGAHFANPNALLTEPVIERIIMSLYQLEEMAARSFDPTSAERLSKEIRVNALDGISDRARERARKLMMGEWT